MAVRNVALPICIFLHAAFCQNGARILVQGIGMHGPDFSYSAAELASLAQHTVMTTDHGKPVTFEGVLLTDMLAKVATPAGEAFHHTAAAHYLVAEGRDGYRAVFAWAELDSSFTDKAIYVATKRDGKPLPANDGPFQLVVPGEKRNARWVRQLTVLRIEPNPTPYGSEQARWIRENLPELQSIKTGMTRGQLLKVFMEEGGISTRSWRRYAYRKCGYVKVDVKFAPVGDPDPYRENPDDRITEISKPYLEFEIRD
jgi:hypothetical protein